MFLAAYMGAFMPALASVLTLRARVGKMLRYYWVTTRDCVRPEVILRAMRDAGLHDAKRTVDLGVFSEY